MESMMNLGFQKYKEIDMNTYEIKITFLWDDGNDTNLVRITVPYNIEIEQLNEKIIETHEKLCADEDGEDIYGINGRNVETLMNYMCEKNSWHWEKAEPDDDIVLA